MKKLLSKKAFTLVEMLIVVVIIGILAAALIPKLTGAQARARDAARKANLNQATAAVAVYFSDNGVYPGKGAAGSESGTLSLGDIKDDLIPTYINSIPKDPQAQKLTHLFEAGPSGTGQYAYAPITRNQTKYAGMVLAANIESEGNNANWAVIGVDIDTGDNNPTDANINTGVRSSINLDKGLIVTSTTPSTASEAIELEKTLCDKVYVTGGTEGNLSDQDNCLSPSINAMLYLVIQ